MGNSFHSLSGVSCRKGKSDWHALIKEEVGKGGSKTDFYFSAVHAPYPRWVVVSGTKFTFKYSRHDLRVEEGLDFVASITDDPIYRWVSRVPWAPACQNLPPITSLML